MSKDILRKAAECIRNAEALLITAGAGMSVDSGLPDFRGPEGFWKAYPPIKEKGLSFPEISTPRWFAEDPAFAWGFFGHRLKLYTGTQPHHGFQILKKWAAKVKGGYFVFTSNVDGHFQKAGFTEDRVVECHGSINYMQCCKYGSSVIWKTPEDLDISINMDTLTAAQPLPKGPPDLPLEQRILARPNVLMFDDMQWLSDRTDAQERRFSEWLRSVKNQRLVVIEIGAGLAVPTVRYAGEDVVIRSGNKDSCIVRINPNEPEIERVNGISLSLKGLEALMLLDNLLT